MSLAPTSIRIPNDSEVEIISGGIEGLRRFFRTFLRAQRTSTRNRWIQCLLRGCKDSMSEQKTHDAQQLVVAFAMAFGNHLATNLGLSWAIAQFGDGEEDITICDPDAQVYLFPISLVSKRFQRREPEFFVSLSNVLGQQVSDLRESSKNK